MVDTLTSATRTRVACLGGAHWDHAARVAGTARLGTSNPVTMARTRGGVAGNVAEALARLGHSVALFTALGDDGEDDALRTAMHACGVDVNTVPSAADRRTASYTAVLAADGELVIGLADMGIYGGLDANWAAEIALALAAFDLWIVDANLQQQALEPLLHRHRNTATVFANAVSAAKAERLAPVLDAIDVILADRFEAAALAGSPIETAADATAAARALVERGVGAAVVTLGDAGAVQVDERGARALPAMIANVHDVSGAGDALMAGYVHARLTGAADMALEYGIAAASLAVASPVTVPPALSAARLAQLVG